MAQGSLIADKYRLMRPIGRGGMGIVYAAVNVVTGKSVAIKQLHEGLSESCSARFLREAQVASSIDHPNVVNVFDVVRDGAALYLVMELLSGESLAARLRRGPQDPRAFAQLMLPVLRGVHAAHRMGVIHRDLKPDNILLCEGPHGEPREAKVLDFGISTLCGELGDAGADTQVSEGPIMGTPQYMAPEQLCAGRRADPRSDVYALGVVFYRALSGRCPFTADSLPGLVVRIVEGGATPLGELCPALEPGYAAAVMRCLEVNPAQRLASVAAFAEAIEPYAGGVRFAPHAGVRFGTKQPRGIGSQRASDAPTAEHAAWLEQPTQSATRLLSHESGRRHAPGSAYLALLLVLVSGASGLVWLLREPPTRLSGPKPGSEVMGALAGRLRAGSSEFAAMPYVTTLELGVLPMLEDAAQAPQASEQASER